MIHRCPLCDRAICNDVRCSGKSCLEHRSGCPKAAKAQAAHPMMVSAVVQAQVAKPASKDPFKPKAMKWKGKTWPYGTCVTCKGENRLVVPPAGFERVIGGVKMNFFPGWCRICLNCCADEAAAVVSEMAQAQAGGEKV